MTQRMELRQRILLQTEWRDEHLIWIGYVSPKGYGQITITGLHPTRHTYQVHRVSATILAGHPEQLFDTSLDTSHLCEYKQCISHVVMESHADNMARSRREFCVNGHLRIEDNIYVIPSTGGRACKECVVEWRIRNSTISPLGKPDISP